MILIYIVYLIIFSKENKESKKKEEFQEQTAGMLIRLGNFWTVLSRRNTH